MKYLSWILLFFAVVYLLPLGSRPLMIPDEGRYAEIPREMLRRGDLVSPRLLGMRYFEKPAGGYWLTAASFRMFGENGFALRLPSALAAGLTALLLALLVHQLKRDSRLAALTAILYLTFALVYGVGTFAVLDSQFTFFVTGCCCTMFLAIAEEKFTWRRCILLLLAGFFAGGAFLVKGLVGFVVPFLGVAGFLVWQKRWRDFLTLPWLPLLSLAVTVLPWILAIHRAEPDFWRYFIEVQHFQRFNAPGYDQHEEGWWFFLLVFPACAFPAAVLLPAACSAGKSAWKELTEQPLIRFALCSLVLPLIFFSCSRGKLATYVLPCYAPLAILMASGLAAGFRSGGENRVFHVSLNVWGVCLLCAGAAAIVLGFLALEEIPVTRCGFFSVGCLGILYGVLLLLSRKSLWRIRLNLFFIGIALMLLAGPWFLTPCNKMPERALRTFPAAFGISARDVRIVTVSTYMQIAAWVYNRTDIESTSPGELDYGNSDAIRRGGKGFLVMEEDLEEFLARPEHSGLLYIQRFKKKRPTPHLGAARGQERRQLICDGLVGDYYPPRGAKK